MLNQDLIVAHELFMTPCHDGGLGCPAMLSRNAITSPIPGTGLRGWPLGSQQPPERQYENLLSDIDSFGFAEMDPLDHP